MATPIPNYYAETSINGEIIGEQEIKLFPLVNSVLTSEPLVFNVGKLPTPLSQSYQLVYDNGELGPVVDTQRYYRNKIFDLNTQKQYRYLVQNSSGSSYPIDSRYDQYYNYTKVITNFDDLTNYAPANLPILGSGSFVISDGPNPNTSSYVTNSIEFIAIGAGGGSGTTTYAENIGVMAATRIYSTAAYWVAGIGAILLSLSPKFGAVLSATPAGVLGGVGEIGRAHV